jgi:polysaccharide export outer membrane protein
MTVNGIVICKVEKCLRQCFGVFLVGVWLIMMMCAPGWTEDEIYRVGVDDVISITILRPENFETTVTVSPDGFITFPYIGTVKVKEKTLDEIRDSIQSELADGVMKYPVVLVTLKESRSRKFFVYGEVSKPGAYQLEDNITILRAISVAGGFTKYGSSSRVKVLRERDYAPGYESIRVNIKEVMDGQLEEDIMIRPGDVIVISEGVF